MPGKLHDASTDALRALIFLRKLREGHDSSGFIDLYCLLPYLRIFDSTDPHDKVFALLPMLSEQGPEVLVPNYQTETSEIYFRLARHLIETDRSLDILGFCATSGDFDLPSWVPDWTATHMPKSFLRRTSNSPGSIERLYNATGNTEFDGSVDEETEVLYASGFDYDTISWISIPRYLNSGRDGDIALHWQASASAYWSKYITGRTRQEALAHTVCADIEGLKEDRQGYSLLAKRGGSARLGEHNSDLDIFAPINPFIRDCTIQRLLFFTE